MCRGGYLLLAGLSHGAVAILNQKHSKEQKVDAALLCAAALWGGLIGMLMPITLHYETANWAEMMGFRATQM